MLTILLHLFMLLILFFALLLETIVHEIGHAFMIRRCKKGENIIIALGYQNKLIHNKKPIINIFGIKIYSYKFVQKALKREKVEGLTIPENQYDLQFYSIKEIRKIAKYGIIFEIPYVLVICSSFILTFISMCEIITKNHLFAYWTRVILIPIAMVLAFLVCYSLYRNSSDYDISISDKNAKEFSDGYKRKPLIYQYKSYVN